MLTNSMCEVDAFHVEALSKVLQLDCLPTRTEGAICEPAVTDTSACIPGKFHISSDQVVSERLQRQYCSPREDMYDQVRRSQACALTSLHKNNYHVHSL